MMLEITVSTLCCLHPVFLSHVLVFSVQGYLRTVFFLLLFAEFTIAWQSYVFSFVRDGYRRLVHLFRMWLRELII